MLSDQDRCAAEEQGWRLEHIYDLAKRKVVLTVMPVNFPAVSGWQARAEVVARARAGQALAVRALRLIKRSNV